MTGCKTSDDAKAAATQMSVTAKCLSDYYAGMGVILTRTGELYTLGNELYAIPYPDTTAEHLKFEETGLARRVELAEEFSKLAQNFAKLTGSKAPDDVAASAGKLVKEVDALASIKESSTEQEALKVALNLLVTAVQARKERDAAKAMDGAAKGLSDLFAKEAPVWNASEEVYSATAGMLTAALVKDHSVDGSALIGSSLKVALDPFDLEPEVNSATLKSKLDVLAEEHIKTRRAELDGAQAKATDAMEKSLEEVSKRVHTVAQDKPMALRGQPLTLATVQQWAAQAASF